MPGQRKRKKRQREALARQADRFGPDAGRWEVLYSTQDEPTLRAEMRRLFAGRPDLGEDEIRVDVLCGRLVHPTTYRLSVFVPFDAGPVDAGPVDAGPIDAEPIDAGPIDAGRPQEA
ncbi:hypothetical protein ACFVIY_18620 [Streptomyces sp. NPDC127166]|uniref:hypothetical protein n=1 Tax=Streptomyces sp. NPDC127166 TaxID=3345380 RepID=UPI00363E333C